MTTYSNTIFIGGSREHMLNLASKILNIENDKLIGHPDFLLIENPEVIGDIEPIIEMAFLKPIISKTRIFAIENLGGLNANGQDRLLKVLEDADCIILATENGGHILPTIYSRMSRVYPSKQNDKSTIEGAAAGNMNVSFAPEILKIYEKVVTAIDTDANLLKAVNIMNIKCTPSIKEERDIIGLFNIIANVCYAYYAKHTGATVKTPSKLNNSYDEEALLDSMVRAEQIVRNVKNGYSYTKNDLYRDIYFIQKNIRRK